MNKLFFSARSLWLASALATMGVLGTSALQAQTASAPIRQADFIVAVVNSEPITNQEVQVLRQRLAKETAARGGQPPRDSELNRVALERLINEKAQLHQARDVGIKIDTEAVDQAELNVAASNQVSLAVLHQRLAQEGITPAMLREQLRTQLTLTRLREREVEGRIRISDVEIEQFLREQIAAQATQFPAQIRLGMILIAVPENSTDDQVKVLAERAASIAQQARSGEKFSALATRFSQTSDRGANGGDMGLRPASRYPDLFVSAVQSLQVGEVAEPVRSAAGFHILTLLERQQINTLITTQTRARHILLRPSAQLSQAQAIARLSEVRKAVLSGKADFAAVAREISQDGSAQQGGDLGWANPGMFVPEFEQVMNQLNPGQVAEPLVSRFGVHLIEVTDRRNAPMNEQDQRTQARNALREKKLDEAYAAWAQDVRNRAYVEMREPPQ